MMTLGRIFYNTTIFHIIRFVYTNAIFQNTNVRKEYFPKFPDYMNEKCFSLVLHNYCNQGIFCPKLVCLSPWRVDIEKDGFVKLLPIHSTMTMIFQILLLITFVCKIIIVNPFLTHKRPLTISNI